jgi:hypothetical protein
MASVIVTGEVENGANWETKFRTNVELFRSQTSVSPMRFTVDDDNRFAIYTEVTDLKTFQEVLDSQATVDAMINDGVKRETVQVYVLDKELEL